MAMEGFRRNAVGPPEWECEAMGSVVWVQCATSAECIKSIDSRVHGYGHARSRSHHGSTFNKFCTLSYKLCTVDDGGKAIEMLETKCWSWL